MPLPRQFLPLLAAGLALWPAGLRAADAPPIVPPGVTLPAPQSDEVLNPLDCQHLLAAATRDLNQANPALDAQLQALANPFFPKLPPPPPDLVSSPSQPAAPVVPKLTDADKLAQVAAALKPSGTMSLNNGALVLVMANRPPLRAGQVMEVTFPDENQPSRIVVLSISEKSYSLKLNDTVLPVSLKPTPASTPLPKP